MEHETGIENKKKNKYADSILESLKPAVGEFFSGIGTLFFGNSETSGQKETPRNLEKNTNAIEGLKPRLENPANQEGKSIKEVLDIYKEFPRKADESAEAYQVRLIKIRKQSEGSVSKTKKLL